jgi:mono/diheme cytochrome c family protein
MQKKIRSLAVIGLGIAVIAFSCQPNVSIQTAQYAVNGQKLYQTHCQNCHGAKGEGLGALYPPLTDTVYQRENRHRLACIVKFGVPQLSPIEIDYILTYITTRFGNSNDSFTQEEVKKGLASCK